MIELTWTWQAQTTSAIEKQTNFGASWASVCSGPQHLNSLGKRSHTSGGVFLQVAPRLSESKLLQDPTSSRHHPAGVATCFVHTEVETKLLQHATCQKPRTPEIQTPPSYSSECTAQSLAPQACSECVLLLFYVCSNELCLVALKRSDTVIGILLSCNFVKMAFLKAHTFTSSAPSQFAQSRHQYGLNLKGNA